MIVSHVPVHFWHEIIATGTYLTNRLPTKALNYQTSSHVLSFSSHFLPSHVFGCVVYVHLPKWAKNKLEPQTIKCVFIGYGVDQKGYWCFDPI